MQNKFNLHILFLRKNQFLDTILSEYEIILYMNDR
jgi:hypothetical protein